MTDQQTADAVRVTVLDEPFRIRSEADEEYTQRVAAHVDAVLRELRRAAPTLEPFQAAVLGAMEISDELFRARDDLAEIGGDLVERIRRVEDAIDACLEGRATD
ncbi:MAG: cell division protein ZapA [Gemmatimonadetes bacterium]|nr:cell division protein ZapA [Gemmatimonadota bacterium]